MIQLSIAGLSKDGSRLLLVSDDGSEYTLTVDARLRAALRGDHGRIGQLEIQMESVLRPRDIQARIRAGETPAAVAQAAQSTIEAIMPYAGPVLAERAHIADRAQRASLRRGTDSSGQAGQASGSSLGAGARTLGEGVAAHLRPQHVDPETVLWDAWRREDGRWMLTATFSVGAQSGVARFAFDAPGNFVTIENDEARWLVGDQQPDKARSRKSQAAPAATDRDDLHTVRRRRLAAVPADELPLGDDALELLNETESDLAEEKTAVPSAEFPSAEEKAAEDETEDLSETVARIRATDSNPPRREVSKTRGRASVPSWDEIMFGSGKGN
jgi:Protein of unknown function (DUF3071)